MHAVLFVMSCDLVNAHQLPVQGPTSMLPLPVHLLMEEKAASMLSVHD